MTALVALTERVIVSTVRDRDILFAILAPVVTFIGFTIVLQKCHRHRGGHQLRPVRITCRRGAGNASWRHDDR